MTYWPNAIVQERYENIEKITSDQGFESLKEAEKAVYDWIRGDYGFRVISSWVDVREDKHYIGIIKHKVYVPSYF